MDKETATGRELKRAAGIFFKACDVSGLDVKKAAEDVARFDCYELKNPESDGAKIFFRTVGDVRSGREISRFRNVDGYPGMDNRYAEFSERGKRRSFGDYFQKRRTGTIRRLKDENKGVLPGIDAARGRKTGSARIHERAAESGY